MATQSTTGEAVKTLSLDEVAEIEVLSAKVPDGPWFASTDVADDVPDHRRSGLALVDTGRSADWWIARLCEWPTANFIATSKTNIDALCATVRALEATLRWVETKLGQHHDLRTDLPLEQRLQAALHVTCSRADGYKNYIETGKNEAARLRSELAAVTQENESLEADNKMLEGIGVERDLLQEQLVAVTEERDRLRDWQCNACGALLSADMTDSLQGHCRVDADEHGEPIEVHCGPCEPVETVSFRTRAIQLGAAELAQLLGKL